MSELINMLTKGREKSQHLNPVEFKNLLLKSGATAQCMKLHAHENKDALRQVGDTVRTAASLLPAAGVALTMHNHIVLSCRCFPTAFNNMQDVFNRVEQSKALVASAFAEGIPGSSILAPDLQLGMRGNSLVVNGAKKPCSLASIADYMVLSVKDDNDGMRMLLLSRERHHYDIVPYWKLNWLTECDSQEVRLINTEIFPDDLSRFDSGEQHAIISYGLCSFNYFAANTYSGVLDGLISFIPARVAENQTVSLTFKQARIKIQALIEQMLEITFISMGSQGGISQILALRYTLERILEECASYALRCCGGVQVMTNPDILSFYSILQFYKFHPVSEFQYLNSMA